MDPAHQYRILDAEKIVETAELLARRIEERFPGSSLGRLCEELLAIAQQSRHRAEWINKPILSLRLGIVMLLLLMAAVLVALAISAKPLPTESFQITALLSILNSLISNAVYVGAAILFLVTLEVRIKRGRATKAIHELRSIAHVIDMHQLTKDPERLSRHVILTESSPRPTLSALELNRYLDYCTEMLSLTGKIAALYVGKFDDPATRAAVNEVEDLATGLSRKIWQKIIAIPKVGGTER